MAQVFEPAPIAQLYYLSWYNVIFRVVEYEINGQVIRYIELVAFIGDPTLPPESDII